jgi:hypothetical protein
MGGANLPVCWSYIPHQTKGGNYTVTFYDMQRAVLDLLQANVDRDWDFYSGLKHLLGKPNVENYMNGADYKADLLPIDQFQCYYQSAWLNFSMVFFGKLPNI